MRVIFKTGLTLFSLLLGFSLYAQIGGNTTPLQYSVHTYSVVMDNSVYDAVWGIFPAGTSADDIEKGTAGALVPGTAYTILGIPWKEGSTAKFRVQFNGNMTAFDGTAGSGEYVIGYMETTTGTSACATASAMPFILYEPFDVDIDLLDSDDSGICSDQQGILLENSLATTHTVEYTVFITSPSGGYVAVNDVQWQFDFLINVVGANPALNATIASIVATNADMDAQSWDPGNQSTYSATCAVSPNGPDPTPGVNQVTFTVEFNDQLGVEQDVTFTISNIFGYYGELDFDIIDSGGDLNDNIATNTIWSMPDVGLIEAMN
ncbi:MAG: hypothetical protein ACERKD_20725 [Prolixibacteraceae bacterium]